MANFYLLVLDNKTFFSFCIEAYKIFWAFSLYLNKTEKYGKRGRESERHAEKGPGMESNPGPQQ